MNKKIAVVEDEPFVADNLDEILKIKGYETFFIEPFTATVESLLLPNPDLLLLDVWVGVRRLGLELAFGIRRINKAIPILFITADVSPETKEIMNVLGEVLLKPFGLDEFLDKVQSLL